MSVLITAVRSNSMTPVKNLMHRICKFFEAPPGYGSKEQHALFGGLGRSTAGHSPAAISAADRADVRDHALVRAGDDNASGEPEPDSAGLPCG